MFYTIAQALLGTPTPPPKRPRRPKGRRPNAPAPKTQNNPQKPRRAKSKNARYRSPYGTPPAPKGSATKGQTGPKSHAKTGKPGPKGRPNKGKSTARGLPDSGKHRQRAGNNQTNVWSALFQTTPAKSCNRSPGKAVTVYHGTPTLENARSIARHGWIVGTGNAAGDGVYSSTSKSVAQTYAGSTGYILKLSLHPGKCATWDAQKNAEFTKWCSSRNCAADNSAKTAFLLERGYHTLRNDNIYIILLLGMRNPAATKFRVKRLKIIEVVSVATGKKVKF